MELTISGVNHWPDYMRFRDQFEQVMDPRFYDIKWLDDQIRYNRFRLWANDDAAIVAEIKTYPTGAKAVHGMIAAGKLSGIVVLIPKAEEWGKQMGCIAAEISSREGWARILPDYTVNQVEIRKEI
jgi:hypothetical protein